MKKIKIIVLALAGVALLILCLPMINIAWSTYLYEVGTPNNGDVVYAEFEKKREPLPYEEANNVSDQSAAFRVKWKKDKKEGSFWLTADAIEPLVFQSSENLNPSAIDAGWFEYGENATGHRTLMRIRKP